MEKTIEDKKIESMLEDNAIENELINDYINDSETEYKKEEGIYLPSGQALEENELYEITSKENIDLIFMVGPVGCGKTTIEVMLYQMFLENTFDDLYFSGSKTLLGFEERAKSIRISSGNSEPQVERTRINDEKKYLHLKLLNKKNSKTHNVILTDVSGEDFNECKNNVDLMKEKFANIRSSKVVCIVLDGAVIVDKIKRNSILSEGMQLLQTMKDANLISRDIVICIVLSKNDVIQNKIKEDVNIKEFIDFIEERIKSKFIDLKEKIYLQKVTALPDDNEEIEHSESLLELITKWINYEDKGIQSNIIYNKDDDKLVDEFNRLGMKIRGEA